MKKKILISIICVVCILSMVLVGCTKINVQDVDKDVIGVFQDAIKHSVEDYKTYYVRERINSDPANLVSNEMTEVMLNWQDDDKTIEGVDNTKVNFSIKYTKGISESTDTFTFGNSVYSKIKAKDRKAEDYKWYAFANYKKSKTSPAFEKELAEMTGKEDILTFRTNYNTDKENVYLANYTMAMALENLGNLTKESIKMDEKLTQKKGKISTYAFEVIEEGHPYNGMGMLKVLIYTHNNVSRVQQIASVDEKYTLDVMYQGPKIDIPNYDTFKQSDNVITINSDRKDGMIATYLLDSDGEFVYDGYINPLDIASYELKEEITNGKGKPETITYTYQYTTVESAVNMSYEYTQVTIRLLAWEKDGTIHELEITDPDIKSGTFYIKTANITAKKDLTSMIPMAAAVVALIALIIALYALFKIKKQNKSLTKQIKAISGEETEEVIIDAEVTDTQKEEVETTEVADEKATEEVVETTTETKADETDK